MRRRKEEPKAETLSKSSDKKLKSTVKNQRHSLLWIVLFFSILIFICYSLALYYLYRTSSTTKSNLPLATLPNSYNESLWGTYRSHLYFGLKNRHPQSPLFGLMWYKIPSPNEYNLKIRHWADNGFYFHYCNLICLGDNVKFIWKDSDGKSFGHQTIEDKRLSFETDWFNDELSWFARIKVNEIKGGAQFSFIFYFALQVILIF